MNVQKILFATDFSRSSTYALQHATSLARDSAASLLIVHVRQESPATAGQGGFVADQDDVALYKMLEEVMPSDPKIDYTQRMLKGDPAEEIVRCANEEGADLIILGTHGRTGLSRLLMGSVAESVVRHADCPVLTIKQPEEPPTDAP